MINLIKNVSKNLKQSIKFFWQRQTKGFDDSETWNLDQSLAKLILPRLERFKELNKDKCNKEIEPLIDEMIFAFEWYSKGNQYGSASVRDKGGSLRAENGLKLFYKHYGSLWN